MSFRYFAGEPRPSAEIDVSSIGHTPVLKRPTNRENALARAGRSELDCAVIVAMIAVLVMKMAADEVIDMITVRNRGVSAIGAVPVAALVSAAAVPGSAAIRVAVAHADAMFIHVIVMDVMKMPVVQIIDVAVVPDGSVAALRAMDVLVAFVSLMILRHGE
jgi:hypothetical protein